jgi:hypothetical protein
MKKTNKNKTKDNLMTVKIIGVDRVHQADRIGTNTTQNNGAVTLNRIRQSDVKEEDKKDEKVDTE